MNRILADVRRGLFGGATFEEAVNDLRRQLLARGGDGELRDVECFLSEDGRSAMLAAEWSSDRPVTANFSLPVSVTEANFDAQSYVRRCKG